MKELKFFEDNLDTETVLGIVGFFFAKTKEIRTNYPTLYKVDKSSGESKSGIKEAYFQKWGWFSKVFRLAETLHQNPDTVLNLKTNLVLMYLEHELDYDFLQGSLK